MACARDSGAAAIVVAGGDGTVACAARVSGNAEIAEELRYGLNHWDGLTRFLDDGRIDLDTNIVERGIRPIPSLPRKIGLASPRWSRPAK